MDAGTAAICGALAGSAGTVLAALATGWAQRESSRIGVRAEYQRDRRQSRHENYRKFIAAADEIKDLTLYQWTPLTGPETTTPEEIVRITELANELRAILVEVQLAGPTRVIEIAGTVYVACKQLSMTLEGLTGLPEATGQPDRTLARESLCEWTRASANLLSESLGAMKVIALNVLEDDGISRSRY